MGVIKKVVIPTAGFGTRFLPITKAQPKEMLPIIDKPVIQYIVEEAVASGIETIIIVTSQSKRSLEDYFNFNFELENYLEKTQKKELLSQIHHVTKIANFVYIHQKGPYGNGTPVLNARAVVGDEPFAVVWGDDLLISDKPRLKQLIEIFQEYQSPVLTAYPVDSEGTKKYGIIEGEKINSKVIRVEGIVEKPGPWRAPSKIAAIGGYILTPDIFDALEKTQPGKNNELWLVDAIFKLSQRRTIYACLVDGKHYDVGSKIGWLKANIELGLKHPQIKKELKKYLKDIRI